MRPDLLPTTFEGKLGKVVEEAGEFLQAYGKFIRHGGVAVDPKTQKQYNNILDMHTEALQLIMALDAVVEELKRKAEA